jgi:acyl-CoA thioesterase-1
VELTSTRANLAKTIVLARENSVRVVLAGMQIPPNYGLSYTQEFSSLFSELADEYDVGLIPFLLEGVAADPALNLPDGIHPNPEGYVRVAENVLRVVLPLL